MRPDIKRTGVAILIAVAVFGALVASPLGLPALDGGTEEGRSGTLTERWVSDTERNISGNHHVPFAARVDGTGMVYAPISGAAHGHRKGAGGQHAHDARDAGCALVALHGANGTVRWADRVPPTNCTSHAVSDPTLADLDRDGRPHVLAATTERVVKGFDPANGTVAFTHGLSSYGYTRPIAADVTGDGGQEAVVVDVRGSMVVVGPEGETVWQRRNDAFTWGQPAVADFDTDGDAELFVALGNGTTVMYAAATGRLEWRRSLDVQGAITWATTAPRPESDGRDVILATTGGTVRRLDGRTGDDVWTHDVGHLAAVHAVGGGDGDGDVEVYAAGGDGVVRSLSASSGEVEWRTNVTTVGTQMMPPSLGDIDGDGRPELVAPTNNGRVAVVDPGSGDVLATHRRHASIWTRADLADLDGDGAQEVVVLYGDGRVAVLEYTGRAVA